MRVLIALDASPHCGQVVKAIAARPWAKNTCFLLLHALDPFAFAKAPISLKKAKDDAEAQLREAGKTLCGGGWAMEEKIVFGRARLEIPNISKRWKADLVVAGSSGAGSLTRLFLGSTARAVLRHASCSVEVVRGVADSPETSTDKAM